MKRIVKYILLSMLVLFVASIIFLFNQYRPITILVDLAEVKESKPIIARTEIYSKWNRGELKELPRLNEQLPAPFAIDLRSYDISGYDLSEYQYELQYLDFDTDTKWPEQLPSGFDPDEIMELGKDPGLGIRQLHEQGITGKGVSIAIIDHALLLEHEEYKDNIMLYEVLHYQGVGAQMHGAAVTSIAVGKTVGVAPNAKVYYIASTFGLFSPFGYSSDLGWMAKGIYRVLEINDSLPENEKIRVISISKGFGGGEKGSEKVSEAIEAAKRAGVFVITASTEANYDFNLAGLGRGLNADPNDTNIYAPGVFWADSYFSGGYWSQEQNLLMVPMESRTYASFTGVSDYAFGRTGGLSWTCPWLAGMYALCIQVNPDITPEEFISIAIETGDIITLQHENNYYSFGSIINPLDIIIASKKQTP